MKNFAKCRKGATSIEYGLIAGVISIAIVAALTTSGDSLKTIYTRMGTHLASAK